MLECDKMDNPPEREYIKKRVVIADKNHFTSSRNNTRKCDEARKKISLKDVYYDTFSQSIGNKNNVTIRIKLLMS